MNTIIMYIVLFSLLFIPISGIVMMFNKNFWFIVNIPLFYIAVFIVVIFIFIMQFLWPGIIRAFKKKQYLFANELDDIITSINSVTDYKDIIYKILDALDKNFYFKKVFFIKLNMSTEKYKLIFNKADSEHLLNAVEVRPSLFQWFERNNCILSKWNIDTDNKRFGDEKEDFIHFYKKNEISVILPVYYNRKVFGLLCLGHKKSVFHYKPGEIEILSLFRIKMNELISTALIYQKNSNLQITNRIADLSSYILSRSVPELLPNLKRVRFGAFVIPKYDDGIDYFDLICLGNQGVGVLVTDISGEGINNSLCSVLLRTAFRSCIYEVKSTDAVIKNLNRILFEFSGGKSSPVAAFYMYYNIKSMKLSYTNAGFPALKVFKAEKNSFDSLNTEDLSLGYDSSGNYTAEITNMLPGDIGILHSNSLITSTNRSGQEYGFIRIKSIIRENRLRSPLEITELIKKSFESFMDHSSPDSNVMAFVFKIIE